MWQACVVVLVCAAMVIWCRGLKGWRFLAVIFAWLAALGFVIATIVANQFTGAGFTEAVWFHLGEMDVPLLLQYWPVTLGVVSLVLLAALLLYGGWRVCNARSPSVPANQTRANQRYWCLMLVMLGLLLQPAWQHLQQLAHIKQEVRALAQIQAEQVHDWPARPPAAPRSFVYLYVESLSSVFLDGARYPNLMPRLTALQSQAVKIDGIAQLDTTAWTIAGIAASQCGAPQPHAISRWLQASDAAPRCIGDQLAQDGYRLTFLGGARLSFAGKGEFFRRHQFHEILGLDELQRTHADALPRSVWGIYDDDLLRIARETLRQSSATKQPFGLVLLTLDTHAPQGHNTPACRGLAYGAGDKPLLNALHCADKLVGEFVTELLADPAYRDVTIIVGSDHLLMRNNEGLPVAAAGGDNTFYIFNPARELASVARRATAFDIAPSVLHALGYEVGALGLGRNLFAAEPTLSERYGFDVLNRAMSSWLAPFAGSSSSSSSSW